MFFIIPCVDIYEKIDMRTATFEIPPQEVTKRQLRGDEYWFLLFLDSDQGQCDSVCECHHVLQSA